MERLKHIEETLMSCVEGQLGHLECVDTHELGEAIDMIKDLAQAKYYCSIVEAMEEAEETTSYRDMDRAYGRMYYEGPDGEFKGRTPWRREDWTQNRYRDSRTPYQDKWYEKEFPVELHDEREGRSPISRRTYMESKELHKDKATKVKDLEHYMKELSEDLVEMIEDSSLEEKQVLEKKLNSLTNKISSLTNG